MNSIYHHKMLSTNLIFPLFSAHSMEEAEVLCDRLGIFVDGSLQCIGNPKEVLRIMSQKLKNPQTYLISFTDMTLDTYLNCLFQLKGRYGGSYVFTMTTSANHDVDVEDMVKHLSPGASKIYHISGTQKFELPKHEVRIADVFQAVENAKSRFAVFAWGLADTTLEDVFIKVARGAQSFNVLSWCLSLFHSTDMFVLLSICLNVYQFFWEFICIVHMTVLFLCLLVTFL